MKKLRVYIADQQLVIQRNRWWYFSRTAVQTAILLSLLNLGFLVHFGPHKILALQIRIGIINSLVPLSFFLLTSFNKLQRQKYIFDRNRGLFLLNDKFIWPTREFQSVHYQTQDAYHIEGLFIRTKSRMDFLIESPDIIGTSGKELKAAAKSIADYLGLDLIIGEQFVAGQNSQKRWGSKQLNTSLYNPRKFLRHAKRVSPS